jgi:hypothetical protein
MGDVMNDRERSARRLLRWYPRSWRATHEEEFLSLLEDSMSDRRFGPYGYLNVATSGVRLRSKDFRHSRHRLFYSSSLAIVALFLIVGIATNGFGLFSPSGPTKGGMPYEANKIVPYDKIPDYLSVVVGPGKIGYTPKAYLAVPDGSSNAPLLGRAAPVYASNLTTLLGHEYGGIGFVPIGESPWTQPCRTERVYGETASGTASSTPIPCQSVTLVLPDVEGMVTPTAVGELSGLGVNVVIQNVHSSSIPPGHIVSTSPSGGSTVHARQPVIVSISVPGS